MNHNSPRRFWRRRPQRSYRVVVTDGDTYAKVFQARSPRHALVQASIDTERGRNWRESWDVIVLSQEYGHEVVATDLVDYGYGRAGVDYLEQYVPLAKHIVTNPPYGFGLGDAFAVRALWHTRQTGGKVAFLLNITSLCHSRRTRWFRGNPPARIWSVDNIVCWPHERHGYGKAPAYFAKHRYCWVVWDPCHRGPTAFGWLAGADFR